MILLLICKFNCYPGIVRVKFGGNNTQHSNKYRTELLIRHIKPRGLIEGCFKERGASVTHGVRTRVNGFCFKFDLPVILASHMKP